VTIDEVLDALQQKKRSMSCSELETLLRALGFVIRDGSRGGHKIFTRPGLADFHCGSFDGKANPIKFPYIVKVIRIITLYREELEKLLEQGK
jgi:hypothetical protein